MAPKAKAPAAAAPKPAAAKPAAAKSEAKKKEPKEKQEPRPEDLIPKVEQPNLDEFDTRVEAVNKQIDSLKNQQSELGKKITEATGGKDEYQTKRAELRAELDVWQTKIDELKAKKDAISGQFDANKKQSQQAKTDLDKAKKSVGYSSEAQIDQRIADIEFQMLTGSISLKDEKKFVAEIQDLKRKRPQVAGVKTLESKLGNDDGSAIAALKMDRKSIGDEMGACIEEKKKVQEKLKELQDSRKAGMGDVGDLFTKREEFSTKIKALMDQRNMIRTEKRAAEQAYREYQAEIRKIRAERAQEERAARETAMKEQQKVRKAEKLDVQPHMQETSLIEQCMAFCNSLVKEDKKEEKDEKKPVVVAAMDGAEMLTRKEDREDEYYFVPTAKAKKGKSKTNKSDASKAIKHNAETFQLFSQLKLDPPITTADIPELLKKLQEQLDGYKAKVAEWVKTRDEQKAKILAGDDEDEEDADAEKKEEKADA